MFHDIRVEIFQHGHNSVTTLNHTTAPYSLNIDAKAFDELSF